MSLSPDPAFPLPVPTFIGALLRVPSHAIHQRLVRELNAAGFGEISLPHIAVFQYPGPDGARPSVLAERAGMSKQAMNQLLKSLESSGYIVRGDDASEGRARKVRFTKRGRLAYAKILEILVGIEREWSDELGPRAFAQLKELLGRVWESPLVRGSEPAGPRAGGSRETPAKR